MCGLGVGLSERGLGLSGRGLGLSGLGLDLLHLDYKHSLFDGQKSDWLYMVHSLNLHSVIWGRRIGHQMEALTCI